MRVLLAALLALAVALPASAETGKPSYGISLFGDPLKYPPGFAHFDYVNPDAPKGGSVRFGDLGTFDNLNPFILRGVAFVRYSDSMVQPGVLFDSLMAGALDEPNAAYGLIAESVELAPDRSSMIFILRPEARFHDGTPITAEDVCWTYTTLITKGHPQWRVQFANVRSCTACNSSSRTAATATCRCWWRACRCCRRNGGRDVISASRRSTSRSAAG